MAATLNLGNLLVHMKMNASQYMGMMAQVEGRMKTMSYRMAVVGRRMTMMMSAPLAGLLP